MTAQIIRDFELPVGTEPNTLYLIAKEHRHKLTDAEDWAEFSQALRESLQSRPTVAEVENMLQVALAEIDVQRLATAVVWDPAKSRW